MDDATEKRVRKMQLEQFGHRFVGATLSACGMHEGANDKIIEYMKRKKGFLVLTGVPGCGKTYIAAALCEWMLGSFNSYRIWKEYDLQKELKKGIDLGWDPSDTLSRLIDDEVLVIDDFGCAGHNEWREKMMFELVDVRYDSTSPTIFTTNLSKSDFYKIYEPRIPSRLFAAENTIIDLSAAKDLRADGM